VPELQRPHWQVFALVKKVFVSSEGPGRERRGGEMQDWDHEKSTSLFIPPPPLSFLPPPSVRDKRKKEEKRRVDLFLSLSLSLSAVWLTLPIFKQRFSVYPQEQTLGEKERFPICPPLLLFLFFSC